MARFRRRRVTPLSINRMIPNALTLVALCSGLTAIRFGLQERWEAAVIAVLVAMLFDALDGRIARLMDAESELGAQLDSLSDVIAFGVTPAVLIYLWTLSDAGGIGWAACLVYAACCALRLARFNAALGEEHPTPLLTRYFVGVPAPAAAGLALFPLTLSFVVGDDLLSTNGVNIVMLVAVAILMVSRVPTFSAKGLKLRSPHRRFAFVGLVVFVALLITETWIVVSLITLAYLVSIPISVMQHQRDHKKAPAGKPEAAQPAEDSASQVAPQDDGKSAD